MTLAAILFIAALSGAPDTTVCGQWTYRHPGRAPMEFVQVVVPAPPPIVAGADTMDFRRPGEPGKRPADIARGYAGVVQIDAALGSPEWARCAVYLGQTLIGTFVVAPALGAGEPRRGGPKVEEGR